jgi:hypothetical protein
LDKFTGLKILLYKWACSSEGDYSLGARTMHELTPIRWIHKSYWTDLSLHPHGTKRMKWNWCNGH